MKIIAICGSLRAQSSNLKLLRKCIELAPSSMSIEIYDRLGELPHFNPDLDTGEIGSEPPPIVRELRNLLAGAAGIIISSPEYAHGVPGSLKNALDWLVSAGELVGKPVLLLNASLGGEHAQAALVETLKTMNWNVLADASLLAPFAHQRMESPELIEKLRKSLDALGRADALVRSAAR